MLNRCVNTICFAGFVLAMSALHADMISLNWESESPGSASPPSGWSYVHSGLGTSGTYTTSPTAGGSTGVGLGGVLVSPNPTHGINLPYSFLVNSGSPTGFDVRQPITGTYDFSWTNSAQYDTAGFLFG